MNSKERFSRRGNLVSKRPDRPLVPRVPVFGDGAEIIASFKGPLTEPRVVRGKTIGGGNER